MNRFQRQEGRRPRRRRHGRANRRPPGQRQGAGDPVRSAGQRRREERHRREGDREPEEAQAGAARRRRGRRAHRAGQLRGAPRQAEGVRPGDRGDRRAHGLEARAVREGGAGDRAARDRGQQHLGPEHQQALGGVARVDQAALLRHPLLQPAALHGAGRADRRPDDRSEDPRRSRSVRDDGARQVGRARQGHAQLHRQPGRHRRHAGDDEGGRDLRPRLRRRRRSHRQEARPSELGHVPHRRRGRPRHDGARHQDAAGQPARTTRSIRSTRRRRRCRGCSTRARSGRRRARASTRRSARTSFASMPPRASTCPAAARPTRSSPAC